MYRLNLRLIPPDNEDNPLSFRCPSPLDLKAYSSEIEPSNWFLFVPSLASFWGLKRRIPLSVRNKFPVWFLVSCIRDTSWLKTRREKTGKKKGLLFFLRKLRWLAILQILEKKNCAFNEHNIIVCTDDLYLFIPILNPPKFYTFFFVLFNFFSIYFSIDLNLKFDSVFKHDTRFTLFFFSLVEYWIKKS